MRVFLPLKHKLQPSAFEDLFGFIKGSVNQAVSHLTPRRRSEGLYKMEGFYRKKDWSAELLTKEKKGFFWGPDILFFFFFKSELEGFLLQRLLLLSRRRWVVGGEGPHYFTSV